MVGSFISIILLDMGLRIMVVDSFWEMGSWVEGDGERVYHWWFKEEFSANELCSCKVGGFYCGSGRKGK